jgi:hypothetical protein
MMKTLVRVFAYILTIGGVGGYFLLRSNLAFVAMLLGVVLFALTEIETLKKFKPGDTKKDWLGMTIIDLDKIKEREKQKMDKKDLDETMKRMALEAILKIKDGEINKAAKIYLCLYAIGKDIMFMSKKMPENEVFKGLLEDIKVIGKRENVPEEWTQELIETFKRKVEEYRSMDEKHSTEMVKLIFEELKNKKEKVSE